MAGVTIEPVRTRRALRAFLALPARIHADDPAFVQLPADVERRRVSPRHAPFFRHGEAQLFLASRDGAPVGRISAQVNRRHLERHRDATGHFGFFDCEDDPDAARALLGAAEAWLAERGLSRMTGPVSLSLNEEAGCLVEGFAEPPAVAMPHHRPFTGGLIEAAGLEKAIDLLAFRASAVPEVARVGALGARAQRTDRVTTRPLDPRRARADFHTAFAIAADAWADNWGFVPFSEAEVDALARELSPIMRPDFLQFLLLDGREVGMMLALPNVNEIVARQRPSGIALLDLLRTYLALKTSGARSYRVLLMGIVREHQRSRMGGALMAALFRTLIALHDRYRPDWTEMSWILETNKPMVRIASMIAGEPTKRYRIYSKRIGARGDTSTALPRQT